MVTRFRAALEMKRGIISVPDKSSFATEWAFGISEVRGTSFWSRRELTITVSAFVFLISVLVMTMEIKVIRETARTDIFLVYWCQIAHDDHSFRRRFLVILFTLVYPILERLDMYFSLTEPEKRQRGLGFRGRSQRKIVKSRRAVLIYSYKLAFSFLI